MITLNHIKKQFISAHPTFLSITKQVFDYKNVHIVKFSHSGKIMTDIISKDGLASLTPEQQAIFKICESVDEALS